MDKFINGTEYNNQFTQEELNNEVWRDIKGYEGLYKVSSLGRVRSLDRVVTRNSGKVLRKGKLLKPGKNKDGYFQVILSKAGKQKAARVNRLVALAFLSNPEDLPQVNHIDEDKSNNRVNNLEWCSREYNCNYGTRNEKISKSVIMYDIQGNKLKEFDSIIDANQHLGKHKHSSNINACCSGKRKSAYGYKWKYK